MPDEMKTRRQVIKAAAGTAVALAIPSLADAQLAQKPPALKPELVKEFVGAGHGNLDKVKEMLAAEPGLLNASWDWGGGDFESAIEGAGHMGRRDIAEYLISQGARMSIFQAAMLGELDLVKAILAAHPAVAKSKGPHGISLIAHAEHGGEKAKAVVEFLKGLG